MLILLAAALPLIVCPTTDGIPGTQERPNLPASIELEADASLAVYTASAEHAPYVVAPRGWRCKAGIGADSNLGIEVRGSGHERTAKAEARPRRVVPWARSAHSCWNRRSRPCASSFATRCRGWSRRERASR